MGPKDPKPPPDLDEFDMSPDEFRALKDKLREPPTQPSPRPKRAAADLDEFDVPLPLVRTTPSPKPPLKTGHVRVKASARMEAPLDDEFDAAPKPKRSSGRRKAAPAKGARARADRHRTYAETGAGPDVFRLFHRLLALNFFLAFWSLGRQVEVLIGDRGLLPAVEYLEALRLNTGVGFLQAPTFFLWNADSAWITGGTTLGMVLAAIAFLGLFPRVLLVGLVPLYLGYAVVCRDFLAFQWDSMLIEVGFLAILLPRDIRSPVMWLAFRLLLFKLYFESGLAKWQSHLGDWQDGSAMVLYYQTAPLPTPMAWFAHHLPEAWHHLEAFGALALELIVPFFVFGPRALRRVAFVALTGFQIVNFATANYGFFIPLSLALHVFLLDDADLRAIGATFRGLLGLPAKLKIVYSDWRPPEWRLVGAWGAFGVVVAWSALSVGMGADRFMEGRPVVSQAPLLASASSAVKPFRIVNNYHLFGHITPTRIEPEFQTLTASGWRSHHLKYKPGRPEAKGPWVAPHQPRVDFRLWFYGLSFERGTPEYVRTLLRRMCREPAAVQELFARPLPATPDAVRVRFLEYRYTDSETRAETGAWWTTDEVAASDPMPCSRTQGLGAAAKDSEEQ